MKMSVFKYTHFFMNLHQNLDLALQYTLPSHYHFSELIDLNWIDGCLQQLR